MTRRGWWGILLAVGMLAGVYAALVGAKVLAAFFPDPTQAGAVWQAPTREPCTPVADDLNPPVYPYAGHVAVLPAATPQWLGVIKTISFRTPDSPAQVAAFYQTTMTQDGWSADYQPTPDLKPPSPDQYASDPTILETLGFSAFCGTASAHPPRVYVVIHAPADGLTLVELQVH